MRKIKHINKDDKTDGLWMSAQMHMAQQSG
jgi:hypothetical protein